MGLKKFEEASRLIREHPELSAFVGSRDDELVSKAEVALGCHFPPTYRRFLSEFGAGGFGSKDVYGVIHDDFAHSTVPDAIWATLDDRASWGLPATMVVIGYDGLGGASVIETAQVDGNGESPVLHWSLNLSKPGDDLEVLAPDFGTFLLAEVRRAIEIERNHS